LALMKPKRPLIGSDVRSEFLDERLTRSVIGAFYAVYNALGYGYLESVYCAALEYALRKRGHTVDREVSVEVFYDGVAIAWYRVDMLVDGRLLLELKSTQRLPPITPRQTLNLLKSTRLQLALILHFGPEPAFYRLIHTDKRF